MRRRRPPLPPAPPLMLVSAIIPTYNYAHFVARAIDSVLAQTYDQLECIVVDDGSTDDTPAVLARYADRIKIHRQQNRGLSAARNTGIALAKGEAIALLDSDDEWRPEKIARQVKVLHDRSSVLVVGCGITVADEGPVRDYTWPSPGTGPAVLRSLALRRAWVGGSGSGALIRRSTLETVGGFDEKLTACEDLDMWLRIAALGPVANVQVPLTIIHKHGTGSFRNVTKMETNARRVYELAAERWPNVFDVRTLREIRALVSVDAGMELAHAGQHVRALERYLHALREAPLDPKTWHLAARGVFKILGV